MWAVSHVMTEVELHKRHKTFQCMMNTIQELKEKALFTQFDFVFSDSKLFPLEHFSSKYGNLINAS